MNSSTAEQFDRKTDLQTNSLTNEHIVNAVLLKLRPELYQSRYNLSAIKVKQDTIQAATLP